MSAFLTSSRRIGSIAFALALGVAGLASPAFAAGPTRMQSFSHGGYSGHSGGMRYAHGGSSFRGHGGYGHGGYGYGGWGGGVGAGLVGGLIGGAILGSVASQYDANPCWQYQDIYSAAGAYLGRQLVNTCL